MTTLSQKAKQSSTPTKASAGKLPRLISKSLFVDYSENPKLAWWRWNQPDIWRKVAGFDEGEEAELKLERGREVEAAVRVQLEREVGFKAVVLFANDPAKDEGSDADETWAESGDFSAEIAKNVRATLAALKAGKRLLYQPGFLVDDLYVRADFLVRESDTTYRLVEVKACNGIRKGKERGGCRFPDAGEVEARFLNDVAFQRHVIALAFEREGLDLRIAGCEIAHLNRDFRKGRRAADPLVTIERLGIGSEFKIPARGKKSPELIQREDRIPSAEEVEKKITTMRQELGLPEKEFNKLHPFRGTGYREYFGKEERPYGTIYGAGIDGCAAAQTVKGLHEAGHTDLNALLPAETGAFKGKAGEAIELFRKAKKTGGHVIDKPAIQEFLDGFEFPIRFYDYETVAVPVPLFDGTSPYQQAVVQYSLHTLHEDGRIEHAGALLERLAGKRTDCAVQLAGAERNPPVGWNRAITGGLRDIADAFLEDIGDVATGSFVAWNKSFECGCNKGIGNMFPEIAAEFDQITKRTLDLEDPFSKRMFFDIGFKGSSSIKKVLPVLVPELKYEGLPIKKGNQAMTTLAQLVDGQVDDGKREETVRDLLTYCRLDSFAMLRIYKVLQNLCGQK